MVSTSLWLSLELLILNQIFAFLIKIFHNVIEKKNLHCAKIFQWKSRTFFGDDFGELQAKWKINYLSDSHQQSCRFDGNAYFLITSLGSNNVNLRPSRWLPDRLVVCKMNVPIVHVDYLHASAYSGSPDQQLF